MNKPDELMDWVEVLPNYSPAHQMLEAINLMVAAAEELATNHESYTQEAIVCGAEIVREVERVTRLTAKLVDACDGGPKRVRKEI